MYTHLLFTLALATSFGPVVHEHEAQVAPDRKKEISQSLERVAHEAHALIDAGDEASKLILTEVERHVKSTVADHLKKLKVKLIAFQQEEEEEEVRRDRPRDRDRNREAEARREQVEQAMRRAREAMEERRQRAARDRGDRERGDRDRPRIREEREAREGGRERVEIEIRERRREDSPPPGLGPIQRQLREQVQRIERLEVEVHRLHEEVDRLSPRGRDARMPMGIDVGRPQRLGALIESRGRNRDVGTNPEVRVRALEQAPATLKARAQEQDEQAKHDARRREEARAAAQREAMEEARRKEIQAMRLNLEQIRSKRAQVKKQHEEKKAAVKRNAADAIAQIDSSFKKMDREMERAIAEGERRLERLNERKERERD